MRGAPAAIAVHCPSGPLLRLVSSSVVVHMLSSLSTVGCLRRGAIWHMRGCLHDVIGGCAIRQQAYLRYVSIVWCLKSGNMRQMSGLLPV